MKHPDDEELFAWLEGACEPGRQRELEQWSTTAAAQERLAAARALLDSLREQPEVELLPGVEARIDARRRQRVTRLGGVLVALAAAAVLLIAPPEELRTKSAASNASRWTGVELYRLRSGGSPQRVERAFGANDSMLIAYRNGDEPPYSHLLVFGVTSSKQVFWYFPEWLDASSDPASVSVSAARSPVELHERIVHELPRGPLAVHAVFSRAPLHVSQIERLIHDAADVTADLPLAETSQHTLLLEVE